MPDTASSEMGAPSILVVDDTPANLQMLADMLKRRCYRAPPCSERKTGAAGRQGRPRPT